MHEDKSILFQAWCIMIDSNVHTKNVNDLKKFDSTIYHTKTIDDRLCDCFVRLCCISSKMTCTKFQMHNFAARTPGCRHGLYKCVAFENYCMIHKINVYHNF